MRSTRYLRPMRHRCPYCQQPGISALAARWSHRASPATCACCGGLSHVAASQSSGIAVATWLVLVAGLVLAAGLVSWWAAAAGCLLATACNLWAWRHAELFPIDPRSAQAARQAGWAMTLLVAIATLLGG